MEDPANTPVRVRRNAVLLRAGGLHPTIAFDGDRTWTTTIEESTGDGDDRHDILFTISMRKRRNRRFKTSFKLVIDGEEEDVKSLAEALIRMSGGGRGANGSSSVAGTAQAAASNSVTVRRASVIRV